jgi:hypothetical protein
MNRFTYGLFSGSELLVTGYLDRLQKIQLKMVSQIDAKQVFIPSRGFVAVHTGHPPDISIRRIELVTPKELEELRNNTAVSEQGAGGLRSEDPTRAT